MYRSRQLDGTVITKAAGLMMFGALFIYFGVHSWQDRRNERAKLIEAATLRTADEEPLPLDAWDRAMAYIKPVLLLIFGPAMILLGLNILSTLGE